jgi:hypothetical protein
MASAQTGQKKYIFSLCGICITNRTIVRLSSFSEQ